jgi:transcriptional regulator with XRE-family HTH domain
MDDAAVGARIRAARLARGLSLRELARRLDLAHSTVSDIEAGTRSLRVTELVHLSTVLEMSPEEILASGEPVSLEAARAAARSATEAASAALAAWVSAAERAVQLAEAELARMQDAGERVLPLPTRLEHFLPAPREVGVASDRVADARDALADIAGLVVPMPLPATGD